MGDAKRGDAHPFLPGSLDVLVLRTLAGGTLHGYDIARWIEQTTGDVLRVEEGSLYPALHRMAKRGWLTAEWRESPNRRRARYYALTAAGRRELARAESAWRAFARAVERVLGAAPAET